MDKMSKLQEAARSLEKVASILESIPRKDAAYKQANRLLEAGLITEAELEKHAGIFERNPDDAEVIANGMLRGSELENKSASLGEPIYNDATRTTSQGGAFEAMCREGLGMR